MVYNCINEFVNGWTRTVYPRSSSLSGESRKSLRDTFGPGRLPLSPGFFLLGDLASSLVLT